MSEAEKLSAEQFERRLQRVWSVVLFSIAVYAVHLVGGLLLPLAGASPEMMAHWSGSSQEVTAFAIATVGSYVAGQAMRR